MLSFPSNSVLNFMKKFSHNTSSW